MQCIQLFVPYLFEFFVHQTRVLNARFFFPKATNKFNASVKAVQNRGVLTVLYIVANKCFYFSLILSMWVFCSFTGWLTWSLGMTLPRFYFSFLLPNSKQNVRFFFLPSISFAVIFYRAHHVQVQSQFYAVFLFFLENYYFSPSFLSVRTHSFCISLSETLVLYFNCCL